MRLSIIAGGGHLSESQGRTISEIEADGFTVQERVEMYVEDGSHAAQAKGASLALTGVGAALERLDPDWVLLLGDRFEVLAASTAAALCHVPICHLCGGDITEGAYDDAFRHAITKLSHLHCPSNPEAAARLLQMGEDPWRVSMTGSPGLDALHAIPPLPHAEVFARLGLDAALPCLLVTHHPTTLAQDFGRSELQAIFDALDARPDLQIVFTGINADGGGAAANAMLQDYVARRAGAVFHHSLGQTLYCQTLPHMQAVLGNSSSGLYEVPSFGVATINIGDRQKGRLRASSVIDCAGHAEAIVKALQAVQAQNVTDIINPYGDGHSAARIVEALRRASETHDREAILAKAFITRKESA